MSSLPRLTLMLYELSSPNDGESGAAQADKLRKASENYMQMAYQGLSGGNLAKLAIGLRTPDYRQQLRRNAKSRARRVKRKSQLPGLGAAHS